MPARVRRTARSFAVVFVAFWIYRLLVAPWIDPSFALSAQPGASDMDLDRIREADEQRLAKYARIFPPGSWELDRPIMLESEGIELLMKDYETLSDGQIRLSQCTMLYLSSDDARDPTSGRVVILRAPEGALLKFDSDLNLRRGKVGKLIGGQLNGPVTIHGSPSQPGADDELFIATRDVRMDERHAWSNNLVEFRYGPNHGQGRDLTIHLLPASGAGQRRGPNIGGAERFELARDVTMHLQADSAAFFPGDEPAGSAIVSPANPPSGRGALDKPPVDIRCQGPFRFNLVSRAASFEDRVNVYRTLPEGVSDQMMCEELLVSFGNKPRPTAQSSSPVVAQNSVTVQSRISLQAERIKAIGNPVTVDAPSNEVFVRANLLEYEIPRRRVAIQAAPKQADASLTWKQNEFGGRSLVVERPVLTALPIVTAVGGGWFRMVDPDNPTRVLRTNWSRELNMRPVENSHLLSLLGEAHANFDQFGDLQAEEIHLWLVELGKLEAPRAALVDRGAPSATASRASKSNNPGRQQHPVTPQRMQAVHRVRFDSPQLSGDAELLEVWFDPAGRLRPTPQKKGGMQPGPVGDGLLGANDRRGPQASSAGKSPAAPLLMSSATTTGGGAPRAQAGTESQQRFELHGQRIQVQLVSEGELTQVNDVAITGKVHFLETRTERPADQPIDIRGDWLGVQNAATPQKTTVVVNGKPAFFAIRGIQMTGDEIHLDRGQNLVWIDGAGRMILPATANRTSGHNSANQGQIASFDALSAAPVSIDFAGGMNFDGRVARYKKQVLIQSETQTLRRDQPNTLETRRRTLETDRVEVTLRRPVDFASQRVNQDAEVEQVSCFDGVIMAERTSDQRGEVSRQTLVTRDLTIRQTTGDVHALGPGNLELTRLSSTTPIAGPTIPRPQPSSQKPDGLLYIYVKFEREITGNLRPQQLTLHEDVRGVYGPVEHWGDKLELSPKRIAPQVVTFRCDALHVRQVPGNVTNTRTDELETVGNTDVDGETFSARAHSLTYVVDKRQLTFRGDGRSIADLYYQPQPGGAWTRARAGKIEYWPATGQVNVNDAQFFDLGQLGGALPNDKRTR